MSSWRMARAVVPLTPTSNPRHLWLVSGGVGWVLLGFMELEDTQGRRTDVGNVCPRAELVSPCCAGSQRALNDPGLSSHLTLPSSCFCLGRMDGAVVTVGPDQGTGPGPREPFPWEHSLGRWRAVHGNSQ